MDEESKIQEEIRVLNQKIEAARTLTKPRERKRPKIWAIILLMTVVWGLYGLQLHYHNRLPRPFLIILSSGLAVGGLIYILFCLKKRKVNFAGQYGPGYWYYRDEEPFFYWLSMASISLMTLGATYEALYLIFRK